MLILSIFITGRLFTSKTTLETPLEFYLCLFNGCRSSASGGAIFTESFPLAVDACTFRLCHTDDCGGGICSTDQDTVITRCCFRETSASLGGGAIRITKTQNGVVNLTGVLRASADSSGSYLIAKSTSKVINFNSTSARADIYGVFDYYQDTSVYIGFSHFENITSVSGLAINYADDGCKYCMNYRVNFIKITSPGALIVGIRHPFRMESCVIAQCSFGEPFGSSLTDGVLTDCLLCFSPSKLSQYNIKNSGCTNIGSAMTANPIELTMCNNEMSAFFTVPKGSVRWFVSLLHILLAQ